MATVISSEAAQVVFSWKHTYDVFWFSVNTFGIVSFVVSPIESLQPLENYTTVDVSGEGRVVCVSRGGVA